MPATNLPPDRATLRRMLRRAYGQVWAPTDDDFAVEIPHQLHTLYRTRLSNGQWVVVKIAPAPDVPLLTDEADPITAEVEALPMIAEHTDVPVPVMHHHDDSHEVVGAEWFCMSLVEGESLADAPDGQRPALLGQFGRANRELNQIAGDGFGRFLQPGLDSWRDAFTGIMEDALSDAQRFGAPLGMDPDVLHHLVLGVSPTLDGVTEPRYCGWSLWPDEALVQEDRLVGIVGHSHGFWGDELMEPSYSGFLDDEDHDALLAGRSRGPLDEDELVRVDLYDLLRLVLRGTRHAARGDGLDVPWLQAELRRITASLARR